MALTARGVAHILANRTKIEAGRSESVVLVSTNTATDTHTYTAVAGALWFTAGDVPSGISNRVGQISRVGWDAICVLPSATAEPTGVHSVGRTATASLAGFQASDRYKVLEYRREGLGTRGSGGDANYGDRWVIKLRRRRG